VLHGSFISPYRIFHFKEDKVHYAEESHSAINMIHQMSSCKWPKNKVTTFIREAILALQIQPQAVNLADSALRSLSDLKKKHKTALRHKCVHNYTISGVRY